MAPKAGRTRDSSQRRIDTLLPSCHLTSKVFWPPTENRQIYIHNTLENAVYHLKQKIEERSKNNERDGLGLEIMACLTMIVFAFEAQINFLGLFKLDEKWEERKPYLFKVERIARKLKVPLHQSSRPYSTIKTLKTFRDTLAHGKPQIIRGEKTLILTREELGRRNILKADWESYLTEEFLRQSYDDTDTLWKRLLQASGLDILDTVAAGESTFQILGTVNDEGNS
jgi:hypothetical protein